MYIFKSIEIININLKLLEGDYNLKINIVSNFISKGFINYISLNKITLKYFIFNNQLYIVKDYYNKNINSKKFKLFLISKAQYLHDINKQYSLEEIKKRCNNIISLYKF